MRIRTALVTARSAPAHERAIRTLMDWNIEVDEAMFLGGLPKGEFLREFEPDFFFDDQTRPRRERGARTCRRATSPQASATRPEATASAPAGARGMWRRRPSRSSTRDAAVLDADQALRLQRAQAPR